MNKLYKILLIIGFAISCIFLIIWFFLQSRESRSLFNLLTAFGTVISFFGFLFTIAQVVALRNISEATKSAITDTKEKIEQVFSISDLSRTIAVLRVIQENVHDEKFELVKYRLCEVKDVMARVKLLDGFGDELGIVGQHMVRISMNMKNLDKQIAGKAHINKLVFCQDMEDIASTLSNIENQLKNK